MKLTLIITTLLVLTFMTNSCSKKKSLQINMKQIWNCNDSQKFDSIKLASKLIGTWKWTSSANELEGTKKADKDVKVTFTSSGTFSISENSTIVTDGNWKLKMKDSPIHGLVLDKASTYLDGRILLCEDEVLFNDSYIDGTDHLFTRTN